MTTAEDRKDQKQRRKNNLTAQIAKRNRDRIATLLHIGIGPLSFDCNLARSHGWTNAQIATFWATTEKAIIQTSKRVIRRRPELYKIVDGIVAFAGERQDT